MPPECKKDCRCTAFQSVRAGPVEGSSRRTRQRVPDRALACNCKPIYKGFSRAKGARRIAAIEFRSPIENRSLQPCEKPDYDFNEPVLRNFFPGVPVPTQTEKAVVFKTLHQRNKPFVIGNPWDAGSARILTSLNYEALSTTSAGLAFSLGRKDGTAAVSR